MTETIVPGAEIAKYSSMEFVIPPHFNHFGSYPASYTSSMLLASAPPANDLTRRLGYMDPYSNLKQEYSDVKQDYSGIKQDFAEAKQEYPRTQYTHIKEEVRSPRDSYYASRASTTDFTPASTPGVTYTPASTPGTEVSSRNPTSAYQYSYSSRSSYDASSAGSYAFPQTHPGSYTPTYVR